MSLTTAEFSVPSEALVLGQVLTIPSDATVELTHLVPVENALVPYFWADASDLDGFEHAVRADERVETLTRLDTGPDRRLYRIVWATEFDGFLAALREHELFVEDATGTAQSWRFRVRGPDHGTLSEFQHTCQARGIPLDIHRVNDGATDAAAQYGLTAKQRDAIILAFDAGYFAVPRETSLDALGDRLDITGQSFSRRLARGLHRLVANTLLWDRDS